MTLLGIAFIAATVVALFKGRRAFAYVLAATAAFPVSAVVTVAGTSVTPFYALSAVAAVLLFFDSSRFVSAPGRPLLMVFAAWSLLVTLVAPFIFRGVRVLSPREGVDNAVMSPDPLAFSVSSIAQAGYLMLALCAVIFLARSGVGPLVAAAPLALGTLLSSLAAGMAFVGVRWPSEIFDTSVNVMYSDTSDGFESRLRGVFSEPSELAGFSLAAMAFFAVAAFRVKPRSRVAAVILAALAALNLQLSSSGTAVMGVAIFAAIAAVAGIIHVIRNDGRALPYVLLGILLAGVPAVLFLGRIIAEAQTVVNGKVGSISYVSRTTADLFSLGIVGETFGIGVGLGANRPSSFGAMLLAGVGVIGTVAFVGFVITIVRHATKVRTASPAVWGLIATLTAKAVALPDLSVPVLWVLIAACVAASWHGSTGGPATVDFGINDQNAKILVSQPRRNDGPEGLSPSTSSPVEDDRLDRRRRSDRRLRTHDAERPALRRDSAALRRRAGR